MGDDRTVLESADIGEAAPERYTLIIADDERIARTGLESLPWEDLGFSLEASFGDGAAALAWTKRYPVDAALLDIRMPGKSGLDVARDLAESQPDAVVVLLSAHSEFELAQEALRYGVYRYIAKPVEPDEVVSVFRAAAREVTRRRRRSELVRTAVVSRLYRRLLFDAAVAAEEFSPIEVDRGPELRAPFRTLLVPSWADDDIGHLLSGVDIDARFRTRRGDTLICVAAGEGRDDALIERFASRARHYRVPLVVSPVLEPRHALNAPAETMAQSLDAMFRTDTWMVVLTDTDTRENRPATDGGAGSTISIALDAAKRATTADADTTAAVVADFVEGLRDAGASRRGAIRATMIFSHYVLEQLEEVRVTDRVEYAPRAFLQDIELSRSLSELHETLERFVVPIRRSIEEARSRRRADERLTTVIAYLRENIGRPIGLDDAARCVGMNPSAFSRWFGDAQGRTFVEFFTHMRINEAARALLARRDRISDIARECGYPNARYFASVFRRVMGVSPHEYRAASVTAR